MITAGGWASWSSSHRIGRWTLSQRRWMFLWEPIDHLILEGGQRLDGYSPADDADRFQQAIEAKAAKAKDALARMRKRFASCAM